MAGENCSSRCATKDHETFGECMKAKGIRVGWCQSWKGLDATLEKAKDKNLNDYKAARDQGIQPATTWPKDVAHAVKASDATGEAYQAQ